MGILMGSSWKTILRAFGTIAVAAFILMAILGCATAKRLNRLSVGMSKSEVVNVLGSPSSTSAAEGMELLRYQLRSREQPRAGSSDEYFVMVVNGRLVSFGRMGDFDVLPRIPPAPAFTAAQIHTNLTTQTSVTDPSKHEAIRQLYLTLQQREPDWEGWSYWTDYPAPIDQIRQEMRAGIEYQTKQQIIQIFQSVLQRAPVAQELHAWYSKAAEEGNDTEAVRTALQQADQGKHEAIRWLYKYLQQREPDEQGWDYWTHYDATIPQIIPLMMSGIEYTSKQQIIQLFRQIVNRDPSEPELQSWYELMHGNDTGK